MHTFIRPFLFLTLNFLFFAINLLQGQETPIVLVTVAPYKFFVEKIAGNTVTVQLMVPAGASAHTYEPTPKQMWTASKAIIWFRTGETFETKAVSALTSHNPKLVVVDLGQGVELIHDHDHDHGSGHHHGCSHGCEDLHFWLSPDVGQIQAKTIADALIQALPEHKQMFEANLRSFREELHQLDLKITEILRPLKNRVIVVSHPAYGYFCRDYQLKQYSVEMEGKDPTPKQMTKLLNLLRELHVNTIFVQPQYNHKAANLVAEEVNAKIVELDPYSEHYETTLLEIAHAFADQ